MHPIETVIFVAFIVLTTGFWIWMLRDCRYNTYLNRGQKFLWFLLIFFTYLLGAIAYYFIERPREQAAHQLAQEDSVQQTHS
jgi:hypothetical protein